METIQSLKPPPGTPILRRIALYFRHHVVAVCITVNVVTVHVMLFKFMYSDVVDDIIGKDTPRPFVKEYIVIRDAVKEEIKEPDLIRTWYTYKPKLIAFWKKINNFRIGEKEE